MWDEENFSIRKFKFGRQGTSAFRCVSAEPLPFPAAYIPTESARVDRTAYCDFSPLSNGFKGHFDLVRIRRLPFSSPTKADRNNKRSILKLYQSYATGANRALNTDVQSLSPFTNPPFSDIVAPISDHLIVIG